MRRQPIGTPVVTRAEPRRMRLAGVVTVLVVVFLVVVQLARGAGTISLTTLETAYADDFNTLATSGTSSVVPTG